MNPREFLDYLGIAEQLKCRKRHCLNPDGERESVAEHCWRTALMADLLREEFPEVDTDRVISMCLHHDMGEAVTGDIPVFAKTGSDESREEAAVRSLLEQLPAPQRERLKALFDEMRALQTPEARLYKALDKLEALISHNESALESWLPLEYDLQRTYGMDATAYHPFLRALRRAVLQDTEDKIKEADRGTGLP